MRRGTLTSIRALAFALAATACAQSSSTPAAEPSNTTAEPSLVATEPSTTTTEPSNTTTEPSTTTTEPSTTTTEPSNITTEPSLVARADADGLVVLTDAGEIDFLTGVNVGASIPGRLPSELKIDAATWRRWLPMMADLGIHAVRIYTVQPPHFYEEFRAYNMANPDRPLYLVHGVWLPEELIAERRDLFDVEVMERTLSDIDGAVAAVHGNGELPERPGYASGSFTADVSPWLVSWAFGIEMDPKLVAESDATNVGRTYEGTFVSATADASPTEVWLAEMLDHIAGHETSFGRSVPLTFTNWPTTDPLDHPTEPLATEDLVGIDANHLVATDAWPAGLFASYHAYPYYPDFQRYEPGIADYEHQGRIDAYAGYLAKLRDHHAAAGLPTVVLEFGVPSSLGSAHFGSLGRDQGGHDEATAMAINADLLRTQHDLGLAGGFVFEWHDEWFKRTWNTMDLEVPADRRQLWQNPLTNEANFGLLAIEPGEQGPPVVIDGDGSDWQRDNSQAILESRGAVREVRATHDEAYLYLRLILDEERAWDEAPVSVAFDVVPGGNGGLPAAPGVGSGADTLIAVGPGDEANAYLRASNDYNALLLGRRLGYFAVDDADLTEGSGVWNPQRLNVNRPLTIPVLDIEQPVEWHDLNPLPTGSSSPDDPRFDSRTVWAAQEETIELRVPWSLVGLSDPSSRAALVVSNDGALSTVEVERIGITVAVGPAGEATNGYAWEPWNAVSWHERPKVGLDVFAAAVEEVTGY